NGYNMILPNMLWAGVADYASDILPRSDAFQKYGDQLEQCCAAAKRHGLEVHVWKVTYSLGAAGTTFTEKLRKEGRLQVTAGGQSSGWLCPSHPANQKLELDSMLEVARKYPVDGLHFDYIRYPDPDACYCDGCRRRFEAASGRRVANWPDECHSGARKDEYNDWRCRQITALVAAVSREVHRIRPGLKLSAAVFARYPRCRTMKAQDWPEWVKAGYLDFVCPMDYTNSEQEFSSLVQQQLKLVGGRIPVYPGIGLWSEDSKLTSEGVARQIQIARSLGAGGFTVFPFSPRTVDRLRLIAASAAKSP
ncbi:MAG: family 10 glycosylhydrolase, partial [Thermoguttaceae bacterium]